MALIQHFLAACPSSSCRRMVMNRAFECHPGMRLKCSLASNKFPQIVRIPQRLKSECRMYPIKFSSNAPRLSPAFSTSPCCELTNNAMSISHYRLKTGRLSVYIGSISRSFSQYVGTRSSFVKTEEGGGKKNYPLKTSHKNRNFPKGCSAQKENAKSLDVLTSSVSGGVVPVAKDFSLSPLNGQAIGSDANSLVSVNGQKPETKTRPKKQSRSKKSQDQTPNASVTTEAAELSQKYAKTSQAKNDKSKTSEQSLKSIEVNSTLDAVTKIIDCDIPIKNVIKKAKRNLTKKEKPVAVHPVVKSNEEIRLDSNGMSKTTKSKRKKTWCQLYPPITKSVVVVESLTKAKVIQGYLGEMYEVLPSFGHVRDLAARSGSVRPDDDFSMVWEVPSAAWSHLTSIKVALSGAENLILASDPDREGEAIAWHIIEMLQQQGALNEKINVARVVFNEITETSVKSALQAPRDINANLVHAYLARRALDYLIGFNVSPLLWRKLPGCQSAGRVQSAALALISEREKEIDEFKPQEYWTINVDFHQKAPNSVDDIFLSSHLTHFDSKRLNQLSISSQVEANDIEENINLSKFVVINSKTSKIRKNPPPPYITSTLQQDAANKLNFSASDTMKVAQKLYEGVQLSDSKSTGLITYMRTDGLHLSDGAAKNIQSFVVDKYGESFASKVTRKYFKKVKNAQEAHEAIRPTDIRRLPSTLASVLDSDSLKLYALIWSRTMACQMEPAVIEQVQLDIGNANHSIIFRSSCSRVGFFGYQAAYEDTEFIGGRNSKDEEKHSSEVFKVLSDLKKGQSLSLAKVKSDQHFTQPPSRYSEAALVKKLEELGIGRPSTYASTIKVLKDRNYITIKGRTLYPEFRGRMVSAFLSQYFSEVTDYCFTADMETELDNVSAGMTEWKGLLKDYWTRFSKYCESAGNVHIHQVEKMLEKTFGDFLFSSVHDGNRTCPSCGEGTLIFKVSRYGPGYFIGCNEHPKCKYIAKTLYGGDDNDDDEEDIEKKKTEVYEPKLIGLNPGSKEKVLLKCGPYGHYVQLGEDRKNYLPKRASASHIKDVNSITLEEALELLKYPRTLGNHPKDGKPVIIKLAKLGYSLKHRSTSTDVPKNMKASDVTLEKALELLSGKNVRRSGRPTRKDVMVEIEEPLQAA